MKKMVIFLILQIFCSLAWAIEEYPQTTTSLGVIRGYYKTSQSGRRFEAYEGIPYAKPPVGKLRFETPRKLDPWSGVLVADRLSEICLQYSHFSDNPVERVEGTEDCLYLNVYAPICDRQCPTGVSYPVIFWIHGGAFQFGSGSHYGPKYLLDKDVILVTINYRLGPLGFLSTEDDVVPGNMGLKDQSFALRWVSENIQMFGGDPRRITLAGQSAGGASVHYHYMTPLSAGLFQRGISFSGTALDCWTQNENSLEKAKRLASTVGCSTVSVPEMIRCLKYRPAHRIVHAVSEFMPWLYNPYSPFGPVVEKAGNSPFIDELPIRVMAAGKLHDLPWISGVTSEEGLYPAADVVANDKLLKELNDNWDTIAPHLLDFNYTVPSNKKIDVARSIKRHYFGDKAIDASTVSSLIKMVGDRLFVYDGERAARLQAQINRSPTWFYYFSYRGVHSLSELMSGSTKNFGVSHADDIYYVFEAFADPTTQATDRAMQKALIDLWVSFATNGLPDAGVEWSRIESSATDLNYLHIEGPEQIYMDSSVDLGEKNFWDTLGLEENEGIHSRGGSKIEL